MSLHLLLNERTNMMCQSGKQPPEESGIAQTVESDRHSEHSGFITSCYYEFSKINNLYIIHSCSSTQQTEKINRSVYDLSLVLNTLYYLQNIYDVIHLN